MSAQLTGIFAIRPEPGLTATLSLGRTLGMAIIGAPLSAVRACAWEGPDRDAVDALLIGSANALRHGGEQLARYAGIPVHAVGEASAQAAVDAGFPAARIGRGGLQDVLDKVPPGTRLLRIAGAEHVALDVPRGVSIHTAIGYESVPLPLDPAQLRRAGDQPLVLLHSAAAARHFAAECDRLGLARGPVSLAVLGPRIAKAAGDGWSDVYIASQSSDREMLEMARELCL